MTQTTDSHRFAAPLDAGDDMTGADVPAALAALGIVPGRTGRFALLGLAFTLGVSARTVYRWRRGDSRPNRANFEALREYVAGRQAELTNRREHLPTLILAHAARLRAVQTAWDALMTDVMRTHEAELAERVAAFLADGQAVVAARRSVES